MSDHTLHRGSKHSCCYFLQTFITVEILKSHINDCFRISGKQMTKMPKKRDYVRFRKYERKLKSLFMIYADFESILVPEGNGKQNPDEPYINNSQTPVAFIFL